MNRKMIIGILGITVILLSACGVKNETAADDLADTSSDAEENAEIVSSSNMEETAKSETDNSDDWHDDLDIEDWKAAYLSYLDAYEYADRCTYSLIYVDEDEIPELMIDTGYEAGGCFILTYHDGVLDGWQSDRLNVTYIEKGNLICNSDGNMGYYYDKVYTIQDGKWHYVEGGKHGDGPDGVPFDENGCYIETYIWDGEDENAGYWDGDEISEEEYKTRLNSVYPTEQEMHPERYYILKEIYSVLRTGDVSFTGHRYELVVEDLTWTEADTLCREKGGYLTAITSWEELERIQEQMIAENKTDITFFVGAKNPMERNKGGTFGFHWFEPESGAKYDMLDLYDALFGFWLDDEPSYTGFTEDGEEVVEDCVVLLYLKEDERCYINDVPDDILSAAPSYSGKIGYICEYDE